MTSDGTHEGGNSTRSGSTPLIVGLCVGVGVLGLAVVVYSKRAAAKRVAPDGGDEAAASALSLIHI